MLVISESSSDLSKYNTEATKNKKHGENDSRKREHHHHHGSNYACTPSIGNRT